MTDRQRYDVSRLAGGKAEKMATGGVRVPARLTRVGVFDYRQPDGTIRRELRLPDEVFDSESLQSLQDVPVLEGHPAMVDPGNFREFSRGNVSGVPKADDRFVSGKLAVHDGDTIGRIDRGELVELSCGYTCDTEQSSGIWQGQKYDCIQRHIRYNHVGLGPKNWGRAGNEVALRLDGGVCEHSEHERVTKVKVRFDGKEYERGSDEHVLALEAKLDSQLVEIKTSGAAEKSRADRLDGDLAAEKAAHEATRGKLVEASDRQKFDSAVTARVDLLVKAREALGESAKFDGKSDLEVMTEVVQLAYPKVVLDGKSADYVAALFDRAVETGVRSDSIQRLPEVVQSVQTHIDQAPTPQPTTPPCSTHKWAMSK